VSGTLYVVATPIGNLEDFSPRAQRTLREVAVIAAEDTRVTRKLLQRFEIPTPLTSFHAHSGGGKSEALLDRLRAGEDVALVSDAGTPGVSDPGGELIGAAVAEGFTVVPIPGPSAVIAALSASGLDPSRFYFHGFLPRSRGDRRKALAPLRGLPCTLVFYEAPSRVAETLGVLAEALGDRRAALARELTKRFEEFRRGSLSELQAGAVDSEPRGECVILVEGASAQTQQADQPHPEALLRELLASGMTTRDAARVVAEQLGVPRKDAYARALELARE
jgi:16S rRNA (cytidine1402-2'-O)-methyltransferase